MGVLEAVKSKDVPRLESLLDSLTGLAMTFGNCKCFSSADLALLCQALKGNQSVKYIALETHINIAKCACQLHELLRMNKIILDIRIGHRPHSAIPADIRALLRRNVEYQNSNPVAPR